MSETKRLGNSDMDITALGVGAWAMGGSGWKFSWGNQDDQDSSAAIRAAIDAGMNWIDTAAVYGLGHSEEIVGKTLKGLSKKPYIFTKCERRWNQDGSIFPSLKADSVRKECEASLRRLGVEQIDLYQIHWPEPEGEIEEGWTEMAHHIPTTTVFAAGQKSGARDPAICESKQHRSDRVLADACRVADGKDDQRTGRELAPG